MIKTGAQLKAFFIKNLINLNYILKEVIFTII